MECAGRITQGIAKEREQAKLEHQEAVAAGKMTTLVEWVTDDGMS